MAATNFTPIILYHTTTASAAPTAGNLNNGELAINITDGKLFYKDNGGVVQVIATKGTGTIGGSNTQVQYNSSGALAGSANFTFNGTTATINTLNLTNALGTAYGGTALTTYTQGDLVYASAANTLAKLGIGANTYILTSTGSVPQWSAPSAVTVATANNLAGGAAGSVPYQSGASTTAFLSIGSAGQVLTSSGTAPQWSNLSSLGVTSLSFGTTGLTPSTATQGAITVAGTLATTNGGTGLTSFTANGVLYASSSSALATGSALTFDGTEFKVNAASGNVLIQPSNVANAKLYLRHGSIANNNGFEVDISSNTIFLQAGSEAMRLTSTGLIAQQGAVFNESGADSDFRIESDTRTHMFFVDASANAIGINISNPIGPLFEIRSDRTNGTSANALTLSDGVTGTQTAGYGNQIVWYSNNSATYAALAFEVGSDGTNNQSQISLYTQATAGGSSRKLMVGATGELIATPIAGTGAVFNEDGVDADFRVESDTNTHALFVDAGADAVAIGTATTSAGKATIYTAAGNTLVLQKSGGASALAFGSDTTAGFLQQAISGGGMDFYTGTGLWTTPPTWTKRFTIGASETVVNEDSTDYDFRVESDTNAHALFVDAGTSRVAINTSDTSNAVFTVAGPGTSTATTAFFANVDGTYNPYLFIQNLGSAGMKLLSSSSFGGSASRLNIEVATVDCINMTPSEVAINDGSANMDFRVESDAATHMLFVDAGDNSVNINTNSPLGGNLNVNGTIYGNENHKVHYPLPYFNFGAGGISDEYWVLARRYVGTSILASGLMGRIVGSRGSTSSGNIAAYQNIIVQSAYLSNEGPLIDSQGLTPNFEAIDIISISGVEYYAARGRSSGGPCDNGLWFEGMMVNNTGDSNVFSYTRASSAGVSVVTTNVATLNTWADRDTYLQAQRAGYDRQTINGSETNFNDPGLDYDFRVESDTNTHALFVDAGNAATRIADQVVFSAADAIGDPIGIVWAKPIGVNYTSNNGPTSYTIRLSCASIGEYFAIIRVVGLDPYADTGYYRYEAQVVGYLSTGIGTVISANETPNQSPTFGTPTFAADQVNIAVTTPSTNYRFQVTAEIYPRGAAATTRTFLLSIV